MMTHNRLAAALLTTVMLGACSDPDLGSRTGSPMDALPAHISPLHPQGLRAEWSSDSRKIMFLGALIGDVYELEIASGEKRALTAHFDHAGFTRARYLANGDILLCGPEDAADNSEDGGRWHSVMWHLAATLDQPATPLGEKCHEGPAPARNSMRIAWNVSDFPDKVVFGRSEIWMATLDTSGDQPKLINKQMVVDRSAFYGLAFLEVQDFRPPQETELLFSAYAWRGGEVMGIDLASGDITNYSQDWGYDEPEGVFPDGEHITVEREPYTYTAVPKGDIDIWKLKLDGSGDYQRMTRFTDFQGFGASNPVVSPNGRYMAFQLRIKGGDHGNGAGLLLYDLQAGAHP